MVSGRAENVSSMRASCHCLSEGDNRRTLVSAVALWLRSTVTQMLDAEDLAALLGELP